MMNTPTTTALLSVALVSDALKSAKDALESMIALKRPDLLDPATAQFALQRVGQHGGTGEFLQEAMRKLDAAQNQLLLEACQPPQPTGFATVLRRWDVEIGSVGAVEDEPQYVVTCRPAGGQVLVDIALADADLAAADGAPALLLTVEINGGLPCVHVHSGAVDELATSIFADVGGAVVVREGDAGNDCKQVHGFQPSLARVTSFISDAAAPLTAVVDTPTET
jgi:hypothetical protein